MGLFKLSGDSSPAVPPNPNPMRFVIDDIREFHGSRTITIADVVYPDCTTFEGKKILVFEAEAQELSSAPNLIRTFLVTKPALLHVSPRLLKDTLMPRHMHFGKVSVNSVL